MHRRTRQANNSGQHRLVFIADMDQLPAAVALWQSPEIGLSPARQVLITALRHAISTRLTARQREAVELHYFEGLSQGQIARRLGISQQVVHKRLHGDRRNGRMVGGALPRLRSALAPLVNPPQGRAPIEQDEQ